MERFWNIIHYFAYKAEYKIHLWSNKINPILYLYKLSFAKKHFKKIDINPVNELNNAYKKTDIVGISGFFAGNLMNALLFFICFGIYCIYNGLKKDFLINSVYVIIIIGIISFISNYFLLFRKDKYLKYFKEFDKMKHQEKKKWAMISLLIFGGVLLFLVGSFAFMIYRLNN
ncbi:hypothetical protein [uncultured Bacteroides sp.]|uniref:hypothetical protein n=1 Tax=uncultured Bacteroides sp. TaxID=162156 RepID=UPI002AAC2C33|nr:hypothetical protein [uncultured Bacteroides sp.]